MIKKEDPELIEVSSPMSFSKHIIPIQDKTNVDLNPKIICSIITKKQKDFIIKTNKSFYIEFGKLYTKNILLKTKLSELLNEKKRLNQAIIKNEIQMKKQINENSQKNDLNYEIINKNVLKYYRKRKRVRRRKNEIIYNYYCNYPDCNKSYPSKGSLNMHIKLKHQNNLKYNFSNENMN